MVKLDMKSIIVTIIAVILLSYLITLVNFAQLYQYIRDHPLYLLALFSLYFIIIIFRLLRNYYLFGINELFEHEIPLSKFFPDGLIAGVFATYGPLKSGEILAMEIYHNSFKIDRGKALSIIIVGRIVDVVIVLFLVSTGLYILQGFDVPILGYLMIMTVILVLVFILLLSENVGTKLLHMFHPLFIGKLDILHDKLAQLAAEYYEGLKLISNKTSVLILLFLSLGRWLLEIFYFSFLFISFNFHLSFIQVLPFVGLTYAIGVSSGTPGGLGTSQLTGLAVLVLYGISIEIAVLPIFLTTTISILTHVFVMIVSYTLKILYSL